MLKKQGKEIRDDGERLSEVASLMASSLMASQLAKRRDGETQCDDRAEGDDSAASDVGCAPEMTPDQLSRAKPTPGEYRARADTCLDWAREALTDEDRLACLTLARAWLKAALREEGLTAVDLPLAPTL